ncbi:MAG: hypothetical protein EOO61_08470 [Hymenobacter sp.]|nr:MAG: hypothetical protein EOO61_08470 [Hymenobacter sp.]
MALCYVKNGTIYVKNGTLLREKWHHLREKWHLRKKWHPFTLSGAWFGELEAVVCFLCCCVKNGTST